MTTSDATGDAKAPNNLAIDDLVFECSQELFSAYQVAVQPRHRSEFPVTETFAMCGVMGFGGKLMRGSLVLASTSGPLRRSNPDGFGSQRDWIAELANQLMGRIKNRLLSLGVEILLATPTSLGGENLSPTPGSLRAPQVFAADDGFVCVWIDCEYTDGFQLPLSSPPGAEAAVAEGDALVF